MIDIKLIREEPDYIKQGLLKKGHDRSIEIDRILELDIKRRSLIAVSETDKAEQNKISKQIPQLKKEGADTADVFVMLNELKEKVKKTEAELKTIEDEYNELMLGLPNPPDDDLPAGGKENNEAIRHFGEPRTFDFEPKNHIDLCNTLGLIDYERGVTLAGSGFWIYRDLGARLEWALLNYFIDAHVADGYEFLLVPHMLEYECGLTAGQFPKYTDEVYKIANPTDERMHYMLPTAEAALASIHRNEILTEDELPKKYFSYTPCFRREAGTYGAEERGMVRGHQFNKVEMFQFTTPEGAVVAFDEIVSKAEALVSGLGFCFRTVKLAAGDCSALMARTYDIEIHIPSMNGYKEVSSVSTARDYQSRRGAMRFKRNATGKTEFMHTLNGSGLATSRILPALVEQNQQKDGSVVVPEVLRKYLGGLEIITKPS
ncbi:MAG: serine--tRNA ligase [Oscillospiraceae bacterium]|jgi:seryl-tRNA synthetase|nr:serine--tRNA ligase [Oscillospiraceae bacterium]